MGTQDPLLPTSTYTYSAIDVQMFLTWQRQTRTDFLIAFITNTALTLTQLSVTFSEQQKAGTRVTINVSVMQVPIMTLALLLARATHEC